MKKISIKMFSNQILIFFKTYTSRGSHVSIIKHGKEVVISDTFGANCYLRPIAWSEIIVSMMRITL